MRNLLVVVFCVILIIIVGFQFARNESTSTEPTLTPPTTAKTASPPPPSEPKVKTALTENTIQNAARSWMTSVLTGQLDDLSNMAEMPFSLLNEKVDTPEAFKSKIDDLVKSPMLTRISKLHASGKLPITQVKVLEGERASFSAGRSFKGLDTTGLKLVMVRFSAEIEGKRGGSDFVVVIKPGEEMRVVGFGND